MTNTVLLAAALALSGPTTQELPRSVQSVMPSCFHIEAKMSKGTAIGAGVVLDSNGLGLTAAHVVDKATSIVATFKDGSRVPVDVIVKDSAKDYAILKLRGSRFSPARIGVARDLDIGQDLFVIGSPKNLPFSVTRGIVSALRDKHIQTDAALNPGNSGGPVFTIDGRLVGIVNFSVRNTEGLKFCLMIDAVDLRRASSGVGSGSGSSTSGPISSSGAGSWFIVTTKGKKDQKFLDVSGSTANNIRWMSRYPGYSIDQVGKGQKGWAFVLSSDLDYRDQDYTISSAFPRDWVRANWAKKMAITSVARANGKWIVVMSKTRRFVQQAYRLSTKYDPAYISQRQGEGFVVTDIDSDSGNVLHVVSRFDRRCRQTMLTGSAAPTPDIRKLWDRGYSLLAVGYLEQDRKWVVSMVEGLDMPEQSFWQGPYLPTEWIKERWDEGHSITAIR